MALSLKVIFSVLGFCVVTAPSVVWSEKMSANTTYECRNFYVWRHDSSSGHTPFDEFYNPDLVWAGTSHPDSCEREISFDGQKTCTDGYTLKVPPISLFQISTNSGIWNGSSVITVDITDNLWGAIYRNESPSPKLRLGELICPYEHMGHPHEVTCLARVTTNAGEVSNLMLRLPLLEMSVKVGDKLGPMYGYFDGPVNAYCHLFKTID